MVTGSVSANTATGRLDASMLEIATTSSMTNSMKVTACSSSADRIDQDEGPGHAEEQVEQDEAHPPRAQVRRARRLVEELTAVADDDEMDEQRAAGPYARSQRAGPQARKQADGDDQKQDHRRGRDAGSARIGAAIRNRRPAACRWSRSAGRAPRARAATPAAAWSGGAAAGDASSRASLIVFGIAVRGWRAGNKSRQKWPKFLKTRLKVVKARGENKHPFALGWMAAAAVAPRPAGGHGPVGIISLPQRDREGTCDEALRWRPRSEPAPRARFSRREGHHGSHRTGRPRATGSSAATPIRRSIRCSGCRRWCSTTAP